MSAPGPGDEGLPPIPQAPAADPVGPAARPVTDPRRSPYAPAPVPAADAVTPATADPQALPVIARPPWDGVSIAGVVTGILALGPVAVVLGALGLRRTRTRWLRSPGLAVAALVLGIAGTMGWIALGVAAALGAFAGPSLTPVAGDVPAPRSVHAQALASGNCLATLPPQQEVGEVPVVPCSQPHIAQVIGSATLTATSYPGPDEALAQGEELCAPVTEPYRADGTSWWIVPSPAGWDAGTRDVVCLVRFLGGPVTHDLLATS